MTLYETFGSRRHPDIGLPTSVLARGVASTILVDAVVVIRQNLDDDSKPAIMPTIIAYHDRRVWREYDPYGVAYGQW
jgi:hypothetical protein